MFAELFRTNIVVNVKLVKQLNVCDAHFIKTRIYMEVYWNLRKHIAKFYKMREKIDNFISDEFAFH